MAEFKKNLPVWKAIGVEPPLSKAERGWKVDERPPAEYMNYLQNRTYEVIKELQENAVHKGTISNIETDVDTVKKGTEENTKKIEELVADVSYLKQNGGGGSGETGDIDGGGFLDINDSTIDGGEF